MSRPVSVCLMIVALKGEDEEATQLFIDRMRENVKFGGFSIWPCKCTPRCERPSDDQVLQTLQKYPELAEYINHFVQ